MKMKNETAGSPCNKLQKQLLTDLCKLTDVELQELGSWRDGISVVVDDLLVVHGCSISQQENM